MSSTMATQKIPHWAVLFETIELAIVEYAANHATTSHADQFLEFRKSFDNASANIIRLTRAGLIEAEEAIDLWVTERTPAVATAREAGRLCCRLQAIGRCEPNGYDEVEVPPAKPAIRQMGLFGEEAE